MIASSVSSLCAPIPGQIEVARPDVDPAISGSVLVGAGIRVERSLRFGDVYLALALWRGTGLEQLCEQLLPVGKERVPWAKMAAVLVTARLCEPASELHIAED
jgi:hypothetical protein